MVSQVSNEYCYVCVCLCEYKHKFFARVANGFRYNQNLPNPLSVSSICFDQNSFLKLRSVCSLPLVGDYISSHNLEWCKNVWQINLSICSVFPPTDLLGLGGVVNNTSPPLSSQFLYEIDKPEEPDGRGNTSMLMGGNLQSLST